MLTFMLQNPDVICFEKSVDPDQKLADQDPHCFFILLFEDTDKLIG